MVDNSHRRSVFRPIAATFCLALALASASSNAATDYTDLWWTPTESGWGVNFVQADNFVFATFFIYGTTNQPTWYTGQMTVDANGIWSGPLFVTNGTFFGATWNPAQSAIRQVGIATFAPSSDASGSLTYNVDGVPVAKQVIRQTLKTIPVGGTYAGSVFTSVTRCANPAQNGNTSRFATIGVTQTVANNITLNFSILNAGTCSFNGNAFQYGQIYQLQGANYSCGTAPALVTGLKATAQGIEGEWQGPIGGGCVEAGSFTGTLQ